MFFVGRVFYGKDFFSKKFEYYLRNFIFKIGVFFLHQFCIYMY